MVRYPGMVEYDANAGAYGMVFLDLPGCYAMGNTLDELIQDAEDALRGYIDVLEEDGREVPEPSPFYALLLVSLPERKTGSDHKGKTGD